MPQSVFLCLGSQLLGLNRLAHSSFPSLFDQSIQQYAILFSIIDLIEEHGAIDSRIHNKLVGG
ncbi:hypothetical protein L873DRAFT_1798849 [Choiromyces venosus 120613-1]|uniref:Uncharacterized protein n=1 Tax=Choiromyces venosus 120613-1 TaxID=1336337 RepID=A0A3N4K5T4_9PEZI|nr:hypothetical protein L873DRAFT_1798849 [Choiromyces venosus 120613-1]